LNRSGLFSGIADLQREDTAKAVARRAAEKVHRNKLMHVNIESVVGTNHSSSIEGCPLTKLKHKIAKRLQVASSSSMPSSWRERASTISIMFAQNSNFLSDDHIPRDPWKSWNNRQTQLVLARTKRNLVVYAERIGQRLVFIQ
jgi:hypothetical protein